jgi:predicted enzyme related to lactoylglutathione lyase
MNVENHSAELSKAGLVVRLRNEEREMSDRKLLPGKFVWFEHVSHNTKKAQEFYAEVLGWNVKPFPMGDTAYEMILTGDTWDTMIGGYRRQNGNGKPPHWIATASVEDVDVAVKVAAANGGKVVEAASDLQGVGRVARIADPQGAELGLLTDARGDKPDAPPSLGGWLWNELHTNDTAKALSFYEKVIGFVHRSMDMGPAGMYTVLSRGGVDRGGVTAELPTGVRPHWLPYVNVGDVDVAIGRAMKHGASILVPPNDIPGIGPGGSSRWSACGHEAPAEKETMRI